MVLGIGDDGLSPAASFSALGALSAAYEDILLGVRATLSGIG
jgi:hypothetical protein